MVAAWGKPTDSRYNLKRGAASVDLYRGAPLKAATWGTPLTAGMSPKEVHAAYMLNWDAAFAGSYLGDPIDSRDEPKRGACGLHAQLGCLQAATRGTPSTAGVSVCKWRASRRCSAWPGSRTTRAHTMRMR